MQLTERLTELGVIVSLLGAGLKLDRPLGWRRWSPTWRLLGVTMLLSIGGVAVLGWGLLGLAPATAMLLGAALAPTRSRDGARREPDDEDEGVRRRAPVW